VNRSRIKAYLGLAGELLALGLCLMLAFLCLRSLFTAEIGFRRSGRITSLYKDPNWFWLVFWFQMFLATLGGIGSWLAVRKRLASLRGESKGKRAEPDAPDT
jgi:hypothetical protein